MEWTRSLKLLHLRDSLQLHLETAPLSEVWDSCLPELLKVLRQDPRVRLL